MFYKDYKSLVALLVVLCGMSATANVYANQKHEDLVNDNAIHFKGIKLTPGGFFSGDGVWRSRNQAGDMGSTFANIPLRSAPLAHMQEFRLSGRASRLSLLAESKGAPALYSGYVEMDFLGNGTANSVESNSFHPRIRNVYVTFDAKGTGWHFLAGQSWSLATLNGKGITPRNEVLPPTIEAEFVVGTVWKRQSQIRLTKDFCEKSWIAVSLENPQISFSGVPTTFPVGDVNNITNTVAGNGITLPTTTNFSVNHIPDVIAKVAIQEIFADRTFHTELFVIYRNFYDRVRYFSSNTNDNKNKFSGGIGAGLHFDIMPKLLSFQGTILAGKGIGSYGTGLLPDVTVNADGSLAPISEIAYMAGLTLHATKCLDLYLFGGVEKQEADYFAVGSNFFGYGIPNANNSGCNIENGTCGGTTRKLWEITAGLWNKIYQGDAGEASVGLQYAYVKRALFAGINNGVLGTLTADTDSNMGMFSFRYNPFKVPPKA